jgi:hypothetical protein
MNCKLLISLAAGALMLSAPAAMAHSMRCAPSVYGAYSPYQDPDGTYPSEADFVRDLRGIPCGVNCTREAQARWSRWIHRHCEG